jgi:hypothetical protein
MSELCVHYSMRLDGMSHGISVRPTQELLARRYSINEARVDVRPERERDER